jgi:multidrug efflux system outer membrane protein
MLKRAASGIVAFLVAACASVGPDYGRPKLDLPAGWQAPSAEAGTPAVPARWWSVYEEATLNALIEEALEHNRDLALAMARVDEARAFLTVARADQFPEVGAQVGYSRTRQSEVTGFPVPSGVKSTRNLHSVTLEAAYEIDLWGKFRRATEAARAELFASEEAREAVLLSLTAQVAQTYFALVALDAQTAVTRRTIATRRESFDLQQQRFDAGVIGELDLRQQEAEVAAALALLPTLERSRTETESALAVLLGRPPRAIVEERIERVVLNDAVSANDTRGQIPSCPPNSAESLRDSRCGMPLVVPSGLPSDLLLRRPDLREAEERLVAANARIGVARAAYFPSVVLTGYLGSESAELSDLFSGPAGIWQFAASLAQPIFTAGRLRAQEDIAIARERQALAQYERAVQNAFRDVQNALAAQIRAREQLEAETQRAAAFAQALKLAQMRYESGIASLIDVLDSERNLLSAELNRVDASRAQRAAVADLVKALGGGWESTAK